MVIRDDQGFTLIEVLVALALLGLLSTLLFDGLRLGARVWERVGSHDAADDELHHAQSLIRHQLERAYPLPVADGREHPPIAFTGTEDDLTFIAPALRAVAEGGNARVTLAAVRDGKFLTLVMSAAGELTLPDRAPPRREVLLDRLSRVSFEYFGADAPMEAPGWHEQWSNRNSLPMLIRVAIQFPPNDPRNWPDLIVAPRLTSDAACVHGMTAKGCGRR